MTDRSRLIDRCHRLSDAIRTSQDGGAIRDMQERLIEAQEDLKRHDEKEPSCGD